MWHDEERVARQIYLESKVVFLTSLTRQLQSQNRQLKLRLSVLTSPPPHRQSKPLTPTKVPAGQQAISCPPSTPTKPLHAPAQTGPCATGHAWSNADKAASLQTGDAVDKANVAPACTLAPAPAPPNTPEAATAAAALPTPMRIQLLDQLLELADEGEDGEEESLDLAAPKGRGDLDRASSTEQASHAYHGSLQLDPASAHSVSAISTMEAAPAALLAIQPPLKAQKAPAEDGLAAPAAGLPEAQAVQPPGPSASLVEATPGAYPQPATSVGAAVIAQAWSWVKGSAAALPCTAAAPFAQTQDTAMHSVPQWTGGDAHGQTHQGMARHAGVEQGVMCTKVDVGMGPGAEWSGERPAAGAGAGACASAEYVPAAVSAASLRPVCHHHHHHHHQQQLQQQPQPQPIQTAPAAVVLPVMQQGQIVQAQQGCSLAGSQHSKATAARPGMEFERAEGAQRLPGPTNSVWEQHVAWKQQADPSFPALMPLSCYQELGFASALDMALAQPPLFPRSHDLAPSPSCPPQASPCMGGSDHASTQHHHAPRMGGARQRLPTSKPATALAQHVSPKPCTYSPETWVPAPLGVMVPSDLPPPSSVPAAAQPQATIEQRMVAHSAPTPMPPCAHTALPGGGEPRPPAEAHAHLLLTQQCHDGSLARHYPGLLQDALSLGQRQQQQPPQQQQRRRWQQQPVPAQHRPLPVQGQHLSDESVSRQGQLYGPAPLPQHGSGVPIETQELPYDHNIIEPRHQPTRVASPAKSASLMTQPPISAAAKVEQIDVGSICSLSRWEGADDLEAPEACNWRSEVRSSSDREIVSWLQNSLAT